jgi:uncharacterized damage-inducible protein DinB
MKTIRKMFDHLHWANDRIVRALQASERANTQAMRLFSHMLNAEQVWLTRLQGLDSSHLPIWADKELEECARLVELNREGYAEYLAENGESDLDRPLTYKNSQGTKYTTLIRDILIHVSLHGQYHRGQINQLLRADGLEPAVTDYILFVR